MTALHATSKAAPRNPNLSIVLPPLEQGDHLDQKTFHERYEAMPSHVRAELINGVVHMPSPLKIPHSDGSIDTIRWLLAFHDSTPGLRISDNATIMLGPDHELQPDFALRIAPALGGQTRELDEYIHGAPELVVEIAVSSAAIDLFEKKLAYARFGVQEYMVHAKQEERVYWFVNRNGNFEVLEPKNGVYRSEVFPGLWLDADAFVHGDRKKLIAVLKKGIATKDHKAFVKRLAKAS